MEVQFEAFLGKSRQAACERFYQLSLYNWNIRTPGSFSSGFYVLGATVVDLADWSRC